MKYKKKIEKLKQRQDDHKKAIDTVWRDEARGHKKPGSQTK